MYHTKTVLVIAETIPEICLLYTSDAADDTPCTYAIQFTIVDNRLNMAVLMRSNDLWYGFCNDQYCFSMIQKLVADRLDIKVGEYYHYAHNLHLYNDKI